MLIKNDAGIDAAINDAFAPIAEAMSSFIFYSVSIGGTEVPLIVVWLIGGALFFTVYLGFLNVRGLGHGISLLRGSKKSEQHDGEVSHFQALATAVSGTVGIGNIGGVAIVISIGGPGATFWLMLAGFLGMSTKLAECIAGVKYRRVNPDGTISGGPMYYLEAILRERGMAPIAKAMGGFYALAIVIGCLGIGNMFQSNQAFSQFLVATGGEGSPFTDKGWAFGLAMAAVVGVVIIGGLRSIAAVTSRMVPFMALAYVIGAITIIFLNAERLPWAIGAIFSEAFNPQAMSGGAVGVMILGFQRAVFSNEAGIGSAAIAHSAVRTDQPATEGYVALMEPFIDTVIICTLTALVILTTIYEPSLAGSGIQGIEMTSRAFASTLSWSTLPLSVIAMLFAFSTMISWSYYGLKGWTYLLGEGRIKELVFKAMFCVFVALGCTVQLGAVLEFSDAMVFVIAVPNLIGLYLLAPTIKRELKSYQQHLKTQAAAERS
ncbi:alanine:cation symporter family protein [Halieaceae bacterium IMCC14734]|uniref:Alanine:cation symporter family protein n=1 Tax=Candidatus Litorirhabdus singularis TaxID=2518993 RepID=A0ABT3TEN4_9GAMM|nr:alanine/glycine:cation symporter family protein [Candidatus Litorirhabdus singularis]MCX2979874.1 alanine:cation symporter family protein [Candidatus Litorirhabdus singularis]